jgi:hypothetical protein
MSQSRITFGRTDTISPVGWRQHVMNQPRAIHASHCHNRSATASLVVVLADPHSSGNHIHKPCNNFLSCDSLMSHVNRSLSRPEGGFSAPSLFSRPLSVRALPCASLELRTPNLRVHVIRTPKAQVNLKRPGGPGQVLCRSETCSNPGRGVTVARLSPASQHGT